MMVMRGWPLMLLLTVLPACGVKVENHPTDLTVRVVVAPESKDSVVAVLDRLTIEKGWVRTPAASGLRELHGRDVIYFSYGRGPKDMLVTIHDVRRITELEVSAFFEASEPGLVEGVVTSFAKEVKSLPGVLSVSEERRAHP